MLGNRNLIVETVEISNVLHSSLHSFSPEGRMIITQTEWYHCICCQWRYPIGLHCSLICLSLLRQPIGETTRSVHVRPWDVAVVSDFWPSLFDFMSCLFSLDSFFFLIKHLFNFSAAVTSLSGISFPLFSFATPRLQTQLPLCPLTFRSHYFCRFLYPKKRPCSFSNEVPSLMLLLDEERGNQSHASKCSLDRWFSSAPFSALLFFFFFCCRGDSLASVLLIYLWRCLGSRHRKLNYAPN